MSVGILLKLRFQTTFLLCGGMEPPFPSSLVRQAVSVGQGWAAGLFGTDDDNVQIFRFDAALPSVFDLRHGQFADGFGVGFEIVVG